MDFFSAKCDFFPAKLKKQNTTNNNHPKPITNKHNSKKIIEQRKRNKQKSH